jgi:hypothetical protein
VRGDELLHVVEGDRLDPRNGSHDRVAVRSAGVDAVHELFLPELFLIVAAEVLPQRVELRLLHPLEVLGAEAGVEKLRQTTSKNFFQLSRWIEATSVVISLSTPLSKLPAIG